MLKLWVSKVGNVAFRFKKVRIKARDFHYTRAVHASKYVSKVAPEHVIKTKKLELKYCYHLISC